MNKPNHLVKPPSDAAQQFFTNLPPYPCHSPSHVCVNMKFEKSTKKSECWIAWLSS